MPSVKVVLKSAPDVARLVRAGFPGYRKHNAYVSVFSPGLSINSYWDGGSRREFAVIELATGRRATLPTSTHPYFDISRHGLANQADEHVESDRAGNVRLKVLPAGFALIEAGTFCGKPATAHIYVHPDNMPRFLPAGPTPE